MRWKRFQESISIFDKVGNRRKGFAAYQTLCAFQNVTRLRVARFGRAHLDLTAQFPVCRSYNIRPDVLEVDRVILLRIEPKTCLYFDVVSTPLYCRFLFVRLTE